MNKIPNWCWLTVSVLSWLATLLIMLELQPLWLLPGTLLLAIGSAWQWVRVKP